MIQFIGPIGALLTTISFIPQVLQVLKTKDDSGVYYFCPWRYIMDCIWFYPS